MQSIRFYIAVGMLLFGNLHLAAQEHLVLGNATNNNRPCIWLKWYNEKVFYPEGINLYRVSQEVPGRVKLNEKPIKKGDFKIPTQALVSDSSLLQYRDIAEQAKPEDIKGFMSLLLIIKTLENNDFAKYAGLMYEDTSVTSGLSYSYEVYEIVGGNEQLIEKSGFLTVSNFTPEKSPDSLAITPGDGQVFIRWKQEAKRYWGVNIYRKSSVEPEFLKLNDRPFMLSEVPKEDGTRGYPDVFFKDENLRNGTSYTYQIEGIDFFARPTLVSEAITVTPKDQTPPTSPNNVRTEVGLLDIRLTWQNNFKSKDMMGYHVYRTKGRQGENLRLNKTLLPPTQEIYEDTVGGPGTYIYHVASVDSSGNEGLSYPAIGEVLDIFPPAKPTGLKVVADTGRILLSWNANQEEDLLGYRLYRTVGSNRDDNYVLINANILKETSFIDSLPRNAKNLFFYKVAALDSTYNLSLYTDPLNSRLPDVTPPRTPLITGIEQEGKSLIVRWLENAESDLMGYDIYRFQLTDSTGTLRRLNSSLLKVGTRLFTDLWAENNTAYQYFLIAIDSSGNHSTPSPSYGAQLIVEEACLCEVKKLKAVVKKNGNIHLSWKIENNNNTCQGSILYRKNPETNAYKALTPLSKSEKFTDSFGKDDSSFQYQVRAYDNNGCVIKSQEVRVENEK